MYERRINPTNAARLSSAAAYDAATQFVPAASLAGRICARRASIRAWRAERQYRNFTNGNGTNANLYHFRTFQAAAGAFVPIGRIVRSGSDIDSSVATEPNPLQLRGKPC
jgi:hypothetical protein